MLFAAGFCLAAPSLWGDDSFARDSVEEVAGRGILIRSEPAGARVFIDGIEYGRTPLSLDFLPPGEYAVRLQRDGYAERRFRALVLAESRLVLSLVMEEARGQVLVRISRSPESPPEEALSLRPLISAGGVNFPGPALTLPAGWRTVRVRAFGWEDGEAAVYVREGAVETVEISLKPAVFRLSGAALRRKRFNPANSGSLGTTELVFEVSAPGMGYVDVTDREGKIVFSRELGRFDTWSQSMVWPGRGADGKPLPGGAYSLTVTAKSLPADGSAPLVRGAELPVEIDSSLVIRPAGLSGGTAGLLFAPVPEALPPGSFQIEAGLFFGRPPETGRPWKSLPFFGALRFSPLDRLELAAALNLVPEFEAAAGWALGGSVKWAVLRSGEIPLDFAAGLSWARAGEGDERARSPFGMDGGVKLLFPLSWRFREPFSAVFSPAALWPGSAAYPRDPVPRLLLSGGLRYERPGLTAAVSLREDFGFSGEAPDRGGLMLGGELKFFPPPSSLVFTLSGGLWFRGGERGGFGGLGIGLIY